MTPAWLAVEARVVPVTAGAIPGCGARRIGLGVLGERPWPRPGFAAGTGPWRRFGFGRGGRFDPSTGGMVVHQLTRPIVAMWLSGLHAC